MPEISVVLVEPKLQCNVGLVARAMKNFGFNELYFAGERFVLEEKAYQCSAHAKDVLQNSKHIKMEDVGETFDTLIGTTSKPKQKETSPRSSISPAELKDSISNVNGKVAILLGREDSGLSNEELDKCDIVVTIPTSEKYSTMNISHAAAVLLYELYNLRGPVQSEVVLATGKEKEALLGRLSMLLGSLEYSGNKRKIVKRVFRRVIGRAGITSKEVHKISGIFKEADDEIKRRERV